MKFSSLFVKKIAAVSLDGEMKYEAVDFQLPDGKIVTVGKERMECADILFNPSFIGRYDEGVQHGVVNAISRCPIDARSLFFSNIVLCGGCTMFPNFRERLEMEITKLVNKTARVRVLAFADRKYYVWIGGSILASLSTFQSMWISKKMYNEYGTNSVHRQCLYLT